MNSLPEWNPHNRHPIPLPPPPPIPPLPPVFEAGFSQHQNHRETFKVVHEEQIEQKSKNKDQKLIYTEISCKHCKSFDHNHKNYPKNIEGKIVSESDKHVGFITKVKDVGKGFHPPRVDSLFNSPKSPQIPHHISLKIPEITSSDSGFAHSNALNSFNHNHFPKQNLAPLREHDEEVVIESNIVLDSVKTNENFK